MNLQLDHYWKVFRFGNTFTINNLRVSDWFLNLSALACLQVAELRRVRHCRRFSSLCSPVGWVKVRCPVDCVRGSIRSKTLAFTWFCIVPYLRGGMSKFVSSNSENCLFRRQLLINNIAQWIAWLGGRWRTQLTASRNVNCRIYEHRHFERILRNGACRLSMSGSGSVIHPSSSLLLVLSFRWSLVYSVTLKFVACDSISATCWLFGIYSRVSYTLQLVATALFSIDTERQ